MDEESNIYGTVVKMTVMEEGPDLSKDSSCRHSSDTIHYIKKPGRWSPVLLLSVAFVTLGGSIPVGYICGTSTNPYHVVGPWVRLPMTTLRTLLLVGGILGAGASPALADWAGRRKTLLVGQVVGMVGAATHLIASLTQSQAVLVAAWITLGLFVGMGMCVVPLYLVELAPHNLRTSVGTIYSVGTALGLLLSETLSLHCAMAVGNGHPFLIPIFLLPVLISWFFLQHVPESPIFLKFIRNDTNSAALELMKLRGIDIAAAEAELIRSGKDEGPEKDFISKLLKQPVLPVLVCAAHLSQALGESDKLYHLSAARPRLAEPDIVAAGYTASVINCIVALMLVQLISAVSWRVLLIVSCVNSSVLLLIMSAFTLQEDYSDQMMYLMLVTLLIQVIVFDIGLRPIPCFLACELFDAKASAIMMGVGGAVNFCGQLVSDRMFLFLGVAHFRFFAALFLAFFVVLLLISPTPDSKDRTHQDMVATPPKVKKAVSHLPNPH